MQYYVSNKDEIEQWMATRKHAKVQTVTMAPLPNMTDAAGNPIQNPITKQLLDFNSGDTCVFVWMPKAVATKSVTFNIDAALAEQAGKKMMRTQVLKLIDLEIDGAAPEAKAALIRLRRDIKLLSLRLS